MSRSPGEKSIIHRQFNNPPNPADAADGPQLYDSHMYFAYVTRVVITDGTERFYTDMGYSIILVHSILAFSLLHTPGRRQPGSGIVPVHYLQ